MKKITLVAFIAILTCLLVAPKFVANNISEKLNSIITLIDENPVYQAKIISQSSSWFSSEAILEISIEMAQLGIQELDPLAPTALSFHLIFSAQHGPIIVSGDSPGLHWASWQVSAPGDTLRDTLTFAEDKAFYAIQAQLGLLGTTEYQDTVQSFTYVGDGLLTRAEFSGLQGTGEIAKEHLTYSANIAQLSLENPIFTSKMQTR